MKKRVFSVIAALAVSLTVLCFFAGADVSPRVFVLDYANVISDSDETRVKEEAERVAAKTGLNIVVVSADDIGTPKTDARTVEYADDKYEELCGINTDGILFLINCDTKYDYISTSGSGINYFSDYRIQRVMDAVWDDLVDGNFGDAAYTFVGQVEKYYDRGKANNQDPTVATDEFSFFDFIASAPVPIFIGGIIGLISYLTLSGNYKLEKPGTRNYILDNSLAFERCNDTFVGNVTHTIYTPRSSSSSGGSHSRSHSSTHHSHSGGTHGGGGRHR